MNNVFLFVLLMAVTCSAALAEDRVVRVTRAEMKENGVVVRRVRHETPMASATFETSVKPARDLGHYVATECVVFAERLSDVTGDELSAVMAEPSRVTRRTRTEKPTAAFIVLGREVERAYLIFEFTQEESAGAPSSTRYVLPLQPTRPPKAEREPAK